MSKLLAWCGGGAFVASLVLTAWWYLIGLGRPAYALAPVSLAAAALDLALVTLFAAHHSLFARESVKRRLAAIPPPLLRSVYVWIASVLLILVIVLWQPVGGDLYEHRGALAVVHAAVQLFGLWVIVQAVRGLDPLDLAGIRQVIGGGSSHDALQVDGVYGWVRHPLYLGWFVGLFATPHMTGDRFAFAALTSAYLFVAVPWEERSLERNFGDEYARYMERVRWRIVPFVY